MSNSDTSWKNYEEVATFLLNQISREFGLERVEGKQQIGGQRSGASWEIDAKGVYADQVGFLLVEIRRYTTSRLTQEATAALAYRIHDTGASGGINVSPMGLQAGAKEVALAEGVHSVQLNAGSTNLEYVLRFLNKVMLSQAPDSLVVSTTLVSGTLETVNPQPEERPHDGDVV